MVTNTSRCLCSYKILAVEQMKPVKDDKEASAVCLSHIELDPEKYRLGLTKACRALSLYIVCLTSDPRYSNEKSTLVAAIWLQK